MKHLLSAFAVALLLGLAPALAQTTNAPVGQTNGGAINPTYFANNSDAVGFNETALTPALAVPATSTTQATWAAGQVTGGTLVMTRTTVITACSGTTGVTLPSVQRYVPIVLINRSGGSCLVWPSIGATVETAPGTSAALNAPFTMLSNTDVTFRPVSATSWVQ